jgi:hypothetical protein
MSVAIACCRVAPIMRSMKPARSILDPAFRYVPSMATSVSETWRRFGWRPMSEEERRARSFEETSAMQRHEGTTLSPQ